jgi:phosphoenolpyruvate carboxylase
MSARADLLEWCLKRVALHEEAAMRDPLANAVRMLAVDLWDQLASGELRREDVIVTARRIGDDALRHRAVRLSAKAQTRTWAELVESTLSPLAGRPFAETGAELSRAKAGVVFTAHPTFAVSRKMRARIGALASSAADDPAIATHEPDPSITLRDEHDDVIRAIDHASATYRALLAAIIDWLMRYYPNDWKRARPFPVSIASWVGYDLDGRTDIHWADSVRIRLQEKARRLSDYASALAGVGAAHEIAARLAAAAREALAEAALFEGDLNEPANIVAAANRLTTEGPDRLVSLGPMKAELQRLIDRESAETARRLAIVRAEMDAFGLGLARIHLRVNAAQVRSALRDDLGLSLEQDFVDRTTLDAAAAIAGATARQSVNFGIVHLEQMTARRQLMLCAQILKHVDADTPIRFLIAEVDSPVIVMGAIYLARLYGVEHGVDISPLFETPDAIERGGRFVERLLEEEEFVRYVRMRGRISIQCGFSDSGRFMGQVAADLAIERLHILISRALAEKNVRNVEVVIFNTHGESLGRGGHPGSLAERWDYLMTPWARAKLEREGLALNAEFSFQGGDGFLHFENEKRAEATMQTLFLWSQHAPQRNSADRFYTDINFSWDIYRTVKSWQERLFDNPDYQAVLAAFSHNFLPTSGSRKTRRQSGASKNDAARSLRAIPHNAILQQLAAPSNTLGGFGVAAAREPDRFARLIRESPRMQNVLALVLRARGLTSLSILRGYANLFDPGFWTVRSSRAPSDASRPAFLRVAERLSARGLDVSLGRLANVLSVDRQQFDEVRRHVGEGAGAADDFPAPLYVLHACRMALIADGLTLAASTPSFSPRHEATRESVIDMALDLRFAEVADLLAEIFPESDEAPVEFRQLKEAAEGSKEPTGYPGIQRDFVEPLSALDRCIKEIAVAISHYYDAFG